MKNLINFILMIVSLIMMSACGNNVKSQTSSNDTNTVMTVVALTLSAMPVGSPTVAPTDTPVPEPTPAFTPTPEPTTLRVVYSRAGEIWIWNEGGEPLKLTNTGIDLQPRISSDGQIVVFARNNELYAINPEDSNLRKIVSKEYLNPYRPEDYKWIWADYYDWMLDTHLLYFTTIAQMGCNDCPDYPYYQFDLHRVDVDSGEVSLVLPAGQGGVPYFSPNGKTTAVAKKDSISLANVDGSEWKIALPFEIVPTFSEWFYIPVVVPLTDGSGFRVIIPANNYPGNLDAVTKFWEIPLTGEPELLRSYSQYGFSYKTLSPSGNSIAYSKVSENGVFDLCLYNHNILQETCDPKVDEEVYADNWAPDESKYTFQVSNKIPVESNYVFETTYYVGSAIEPNNSPVEIDAHVWLTWVSPDQYIYIDPDWNLRLTTFGGSTVTIHNGVKHQVSKDGILPFDFSTR